MSDKRTRPAFPESIDGLPSQQSVIDSLPIHLRPFVAIQDYARYTARDQAVWRFLLHQLVNNLSQTAHPIYREGLTKTGINIESIPRIEVMNAQLNKIGWRAAVVDGFVPPAIFIEFLAHNVLVVATDIRSFEHMLYTPAPDIIHESAGHAPFIIDVDYAEYLQKMGELGRKVITNKADIEVYEAVRALSIVKEDPHATSDELDAAEARLNQAIENDVEPSEAALMSRLQWWTTEYGLVGDVNDYKIFGAGLLSSLGESVNCLNDHQVKKIPLTVDAVATSYDITCEQPQLFVAQSCRHLTQVADEFARNLCCHVGGASSLRQAIKAETVNTAVYSSGVEVSGCFTDVRTDSMGNVIFLKTTGPTQLSYAGKELPGQGTQHHLHGFSSPVGKIRAMQRCLSEYTIDDLKRYNILVGQSVTLDFLSGIRVAGHLDSITRREHKNILFSFSDCTVTDMQGNRLFEPDWGTFDMTVGAHIPSVYGGSADQSAYPLYKQPSDTATQSVEYSQESLALFSQYDAVRAHRENRISLSEDALTTLVEQHLSQVDNEWLLTFELLELTTLSKLSQAFENRLYQKLKSAFVAASSDVKTLINYGLDRIRQPQFH